MPLLQAVAFSVMFRHRAVGLFQIPRMCSCYIPMTKFMSQIPSLLFIKYQDYVFCFISAERTKETEKKEIEIKNEKERKNDDINESKTPSTLGLYFHPFFFKENWTRWRCPVLIFPLETWSFQTSFKQKSCTSGRMRWVCTMGTWVNSSVPKLNGAF